MGICNQTITTTPPECESSDSDSDNIIPLTELKLVDIKQTKTVIASHYSPDQIREIYKNAITTNNPLYHYHQRQHHHHNQVRFGEPSLK